jgi:hypothetical protein
MTDADQQQQRLSALLRLKRFEQPPPGYFSKLVQDVHRRQRADLLRRPLWQIAIERVQTFFGEHSMTRLQYGTAMAAVAITGLTILGISNPLKRGGAPTNALASAAAPEAVAAMEPVDLRSDEATRPRLLSLEGVQQVAMNVSPASVEPVSNARLLPERATHPMVTSQQTRYIIDNRPASYEATTVSFRF